MPLHYNLQTPWHVYENADPDSESNSDYGRDFYKIHIRIDPGYFYHVQKALHSTLYTATEAGILSAFKMLSYDRIQGTIAHKDTTRRQKQLPFVLFLHNRFDKDNAKEVLQLCQKIESILADFPIAKQEYLSKEDLPLSKHLVFRQTTLSKKDYIPAFSDQAEKLAKAGRKNPYYQFLVQELNKKPQVCSTAKAQQLMQKESVATGSKLPEVKQKVVSDEVRKNAPAKPKLPLSLPPLPHEQQTEVKAPRPRLPRTLPPISEGEENALRGKMISAVRNKRKS